MREAIQQSHDNGLQVAVSNPCFELWLWLHFKDSPGVIHRDDLQSRLRGLLGEYDKNVHMDKFAPHIESAMTRASRLERDADASAAPRSLLGSTLHSAKPKRFPGGRGG
ncbi:MAG: RloB domain-containing protein [Planctomycetaceae bacterium]